MNMQNEPLARTPVALVVDDEPLVRLDTADMVAEEGFDVIEARTAEEAFRFLEHYHSLQLVITDIQTGGPMDGCELAWEVKRRWPKICVVVASGGARPTEGNLPPTAIFVAKPISPEVAHEAIEEYCGHGDVL